jgi:hypothetical protein
MFPDSTYAAALLAGISYPLILWKVQGSSQQMAVWGLLIWALSETVEATNNWRCHPWRIPRGFFPSFAKRAIAATIPLVAVALAMLGFALILWGLTSQATGSGVITGLMALALSVLCLMISRPPSNPR